MRVTLHIYDMGDDEVAKTVNELFRPVGLGAYHGAVEVYGCEWSYGQSEEGSGVFSCEPKGCKAHTYRESVDMGEVFLSRQEVVTMLRDLNWRGVEYDILRHNCCHWCDAFCQTLGVGRIPAWVNQLAGEVAQLDDGFKMIDDNFRKATASARDAIEDARSKTVQVNKQILDTVEAKADEIRGSVEASAREFLSKAEELDKKLKSSVTAAAEDIQSAIERVDPFRLKDTAADEDGVVPERRPTSPLWPPDGQGGLLNNDFLNHLFGFPQRQESESIDQDSNGIGDAACSSVNGGTSSNGANGCHARSCTAPTNGCGEDNKEPKQPVAEDRLSRWANFWKSKKE